MFCPNCGAPNPDTATTCEKCGFNVKGTGSPKFKGTMLMMNAQGGLPGAPNAQGTPPMPTATPGGVPLPGQQAPAQAPSGGAASASVNSKLKGTMIGVAPPSAGGVMPPHATQPSAVNPAHGAQNTTGMTTPGVPAPYNAPAAVNPLESTVAADAGMLSPFAQQGVQPPGQPAPGMGQPAGGMGPGVPQPQSESVAGVPPTQPGVEQQAAAGFAGQQPGMQPGMHGMQPGAPAMGAPAGQPGALAPAAGQMVSPGAPPAQGGFTQRSPAAVFFLALITCGIYAMVWFKKTGDEFAAKGAEIPPWWHMLIPILGLIWLWNWSKGLEKVSGGQLSAGNTFLLIWFLGAIGMAMRQSALNKM